MLSSDRFDQIAAEPYEHRGIPHSEMALIIHTAQRLGIEVFIESGRARGQSTYMLAKYLPDVRIESIEFRDGPDEVFARQRLAEFENVVLYFGDARDVLPEIVKAHAGKPTAILCDGPKGAAAVNLLKSCFDANPHVVVGFIHDMRKLDHGGPSPHRAAALEAFPAAKFSDDPSLAGTVWMDSKVLEAGGPCGPAHEAEFGSYGPTVGVFINPALLPLNK